MLQQLIPFQKKTHQKPFTNKVSNVENEINCNIDGINISWKIENDKHEGITNVIYESFISLIKGEIKYKNLTIKQYGKNLFDYQLQVRIGSCGNHLKMKLYPSSQGTPTIWFSFNPSKVGIAGFSTLKEFIVWMIPEPDNGAYSWFVDEAFVTRLDLAIDVPIDKERYVYKLAYSQIKDSYNEDYTTYLGSKSSKVQLAIYNKVLELKQKGKPIPAANNLTRIELRYRKRMPIADIQNIDLSKILSRLLVVPKNVIIAKSTPHYAKVQVLISLGDFYGLKKILTEYHYRKLIKLLKKNQPKWWGNQNYLHDCQNEIQKVGVILMKGGKNEN